MLLYNSQFPIFQDLDSFRLEWQNYLEDSSKEFYLQKELEKDFSILNFTFNVDIVLINNITKPVYNEIYPIQKQKPDEEAEDYRMNYDFLVNTLRTGYFINSDKLKDIEVFPYRNDNKPQFVKQLLY